VKNQVRIFNVLLLVALYLVAIGVSANSHASSAQQNSSQGQQQSSFSTTNAAVLYHTSQIEIAGVNTVVLASKNFKPQLEKLWALAIASETLFTTEQTQYAVFSSNLLINIRKSDLIFPFHYFW